jgi:hypothetical protein
MMVKLIEVEPGKWRVERPPRNIARSDLPLPNIISDTMEPTEQVDGKFYTSKRAFRAVGRALGLTEVGNEKPKPAGLSPFSEITASVTYDMMAAADDLHPECTVATRRSSESCGITPVRENSKV